jgi:hypothetical protein
MFVLSMLAVLGVGITTVVQAQASEEIVPSSLYVTDKYAINIDADDFKNSAKTVSGKNAGVYENDSWLVLSNREMYSFNVQLGVTLQGEPYDVNLGAAKIAAPVVYNELDESRGLRYGFVGVALGW